MPRAARTAEAPGPGHNEEIDERRLRFLGHLQRIDQADEQRKSANEAWKKARRAAKADDFKLTKIDEFRKKRDWSPEEIAADLREFEEMLRFGRAIPDGMQFSFDFAVAPDEDDDEAREARLLEKAEREGWQAGMLNRPDSENPHAPNTPAGQAWLNGHGTGSAIAAKARDVDLDAKVEGVED